VGVHFYKIHTNLGRSPNERSEVNIMSITSDVSLFLLVFG